ncbi:MAG: response regulator [Deltaproteobacteria bacterium]|nr:response regulator [Deltaproteobacteria bacterium]
MPTRQDNTSGLLVLSRETGTPAIDLGSLRLPLATLDYLKEEVARRLQILPLRVDQGHVFVAVSDPNDSVALDEVKFLSGKKVVAYAAPPSLLAEVIDEAYAAKRRGELEWRGAKALRGGTPMDTNDGSTRPLAPSPAPDVPATPQVSPLLREADLPVSAPPVREPFVDASYFGSIPSDPSAQRKRARILVVDDETVICRIVRQALAQRGYEVIEANKGMDALRLIKEQEPDALLLDAMLPDVHGFDICKRLKESRRYRHIPVVMMTAVYKGWRMAADLKESYGVSGCIEKPFNIHDVVRYIEDALAGRSIEARPDAQALSAEAQQLYTESAKAYQRGDLDSAISSLSAAVAIDPLSPSLRHQLGLLYAQRGHDFAAIQELEVAVDLDPTRFSSLRNLAILFQRRGFRRKACEMWERALAHATDEATRREIKDLLVQLL